MDKDVEHYVNTKLPEVRKALQAAIAKGTDPRTLMGVIADDTGAMKRIGERADVLPRHLLVGIVEQTIRACDDAEVSRVLAPLLLQRPGILPVAVFVGALPGAALVEYGDPSPARSAS